MNTQNTSDSSQTTWDSDRNPSNRNDYFSWAKQPGFNPMKAMAVVAGFAIFPPLGAAALLYFIWKSRRAHAFGPGAQGYGPAMAMRGGMGCGRHMRHQGRSRWTGNAAFDEHQAEVIDKLRADREAFWAFRAEQRRKRDQDAYDAFRATQPTPSETQKPE